MVPHGAASRATFLDPSAVLKKRSSTRPCHCHPTPHLCGDQEACQVNGRMCVCGFLKPPGSENEWQVRTHGAFTIPCGMLGLKLTGQSIAKFGSTSSTYARLVDRVSREDKHCRPISRKSSSPYDHSKERRQNRLYVTIHVNGTCHPYDHSRLPQAAVSAFSQTPGLLRQSVH